MLVLKYMFKLSFFSKKEEPEEAIFEIVQAVRIMRKKNLSGILVVKKSQVSKKTIKAEDIIEKVLKCRRSAVKINFEKIEAVNCLLPFPKRLKGGVYYSDQELACLGASQKENRAAVLVENGNISLFYNNSFKRNISSKKLENILLTLFLRKEPKYFKKLVVEEAV